MALYTRESIERMRDAVDMVALVGVKTDLRRVGSRWMGLCPFHDERTPSFSVNPEQKLFYCFGCGAKGDAIAFVRETEALDFPEAVELLAERHGVELEREREDPRAEERRQRRERLLSLLDRTARFYSTYLWESEEARAARDYLAGRGLSEEVLRDFRVGYAPSAWDRLVKREHVGVPLDHHNAPRTRCLRAGGVQPEELAPLPVDLVLGGIEVLGPLGLAEGPRAEAEDPTASIGERKHDPAAEAVVEAPAPAPLA